MTMVSEIASDASALSIHLYDSECRLSMAMCMPRRHTDVASRWTASQAMPIGLLEVYLAMPIGLPDALSALR